MSRGQITSAEGEFLNINRQSAQAAASEAERLAKAGDMVGAERAANRAAQHAYLLRQGKFGQAAEPANSAARAAQRSLASGYARQTQAAVLRGKNLLGRDLEGAQAALEEARGWAAKMEGALDKSGRIGTELNNTVQGTRSALEELEVGFEAAMQPHGIVGSEGSGLPDGLVYEQPGVSHGSSGIAGVDEAELTRMVTDPVRSTGRVITEIPWRVRLGVEWDMFWKPIKDIGRTAGYQFLHNPVRTVGFTSFGMAPGMPAVEAFEIFPRTAIVADAARGADAFGSTLALSSDFGYTMGTLSEVSHIGSGVGAVRASS